MSQVFIIDPTTSHRESISHQLGQLQRTQIQQFKSFDDARIKLLGMQSQDGIVIASSSEGLPALSEFMQFIHIRQPQLAVVVTVDKVSLEEMRQIVGSGVDQILLKPFNANQLSDKIHAAETFRRQVLQENFIKPSSSDFQAHFEKVTEKMYKVVLSGWIAENSILPEIKADDGAATLFVDCDKVKGVNSIGIRSWLLWLKALSANGFVHFEFENLHPSVLQQASFVQGFIPANGTVNSFYLYYWSEELGNEKEFKISMGKHYATDQMTLPKTQVETLDGTSILFEIDETVKKLLKFYKGPIHIS